MHFAPSSMPLQPEGTDAHENTEAHEDTEAHEEAVQHKGVEDAGRFGSTAGTLGLEPNGTVVLVVVSGRVKAEAVRVEPGGEAVCVEAEASVVVVVVVGVLYRCLSFASKPKVFLSLDFTKSASDAVLGVGLKVRLATWKPSVTATCTPGPWPS